MDNWREDTSLRCKISYKKKFAILPVSCHGSMVWFKFYYSKYNTWVDRYNYSDQGHTDFIENITEQEYIIRKLAETL